MCRVLFNCCGFLLNLAIFYDFNKFFFFWSLVLIFFFFFFCSSFFLLSFLFSYTLFVCVYWISDYSNTLFQHGLSNISFPFIFPFVFLLWLNFVKDSTFKKIVVFVHDLIFFGLILILDYIIDLFCKWFGFFFLGIELISLML
jgi:hypothetical protein